MRFFFRIASFFLLHKQNGYFQAALTWWTHVKMFVSNMAHTGVSAVAIHQIYSLLHIYTDRQYTTDIQDQNGENYNWEFEWERWDVRFIRNQLLLFFVQKRRNTPCEWKLMARIFDNFPLFFLLFSSSYISCAANKKTRTRLKW